MTEEQTKKVKKRLTMLTVGIIVLLIVFLVVLVALKKMNTIWFPLGAGALLALYWVVSDILPVIWLRLFEDKTENQKRSYYVYALIDAVGLGGLLYFVMSMTSMTGALVYVACILMKKRFHDEYLGVNPASSAEIGTESEDTSGAENPPEQEESEDTSVAENPGETDTSKAENPPEQTDSEEAPDQADPEGESAGETCQESAAGVERQDP